MQTGKQGRVQAQSSASGKYTSLGTSQIMALGPPGIRCSTGAEKKRWEGGHHGAGKTMLHLYFQAQKQKPTIEEPVPIPEFFPAFTGILPLSVSTHRKGCMAEPARCMHLSPLHTRTQHHTCTHTKHAAHQHTCAAQRCTYTSRHKCSYTPAWHTWHT